MKGRLHLNTANLTTLSDDELNNLVSKELRNDSTLMDDHVMKDVFSDKKPTQLVLNILMQRTDLIVESVRTNYELKNYNRREVFLDILAKDNKGKIYNIEIQNDPRGASAKRGRYHSSNIDTHILDKGKDFQDLPETYVIFITKYDVMKAGLPIYYVDRVYTNLKHTPYNDAAHIWYVNGTYQADDDIGKLMQDFQCSVPNKMHYGELANCLREYKGGCFAMGPAFKKWKDVIQNVEKRVAKLAVKLVAKLKVCCKKRWILLPISNGVQT